MKGSKESQGAVFIYTSQEQMVPANHPLGTIKDFADYILNPLPVGGAGRGQRPQGGRLN
ncbi:MAG: hypothetical protein OEY63_07855 [Gemmatimonadota bacterium]|nr:hypothetical protein [Gemmatimonadota bacterium]